MRREREREREDSLHAMKLGAVGFRTWCDILSVRRWEETADLGC